MLSILSVLFISEYVPRSLELMPVVVVMVAALLQARQRVTLQQVHSRSTR